MNKVLNLAVKISRKVVKYDDLLNENKSLKEKANSSEVETETLKNENLLLNDKFKSLEKETSFGWPNGHHHSPIHKLEDLDCYDEVVKRSQDKFAKSIPGFSEERILKSFRRLTKYFKDFDYPEEEDEKCRYYVENCSYRITDALVLFSMIRLLKPKRIIEIGSGFTSGLMMDVNERFFNNKIEITFIEPYPKLLLERMNTQDKKKYKILSSGVQFVPVDIFKELQKNDILFIDSTHVSKFNSDVNYELFDILPEIKPGVVIHFHDVLDGFEYPLAWLRQGWAWNEDYLLRAYLMGNNNYDVLLMNNYLFRRYPDLLLKSYPRISHDNTRISHDNIGKSLWIQKVK